MDKKELVKTTAESIAIAGVTKCIASIVQLLTECSNHNANMYEIEKKKELCLRKIESDGDLHIKTMNAHYQIASSALRSEKLSSAQKRDIVLGQIDSIF